MSGHWGQGEEEFQKKDQSQVFIKGRVEDPRNEFEDEGQVVSRSRYTPQAHRLQNWSAYSAQEGNLLYSLLQNRNQAFRLF